MKIIPFAFEDQLVRVVDIDGEPWFVGKDVCQVLGIKDHHQALARLDDDERRYVDRRIVETGGTVYPGGVGTIHPGGGAADGDRLITISEAGAFRLLFSSRKPEAERFKRWMAHEVLPAIRKTGRYEVPGAPPPPQAPYQDNLRIGDEPLSVKSMKLAMVREARHLFGHARAKALWSQLNIHPVPLGAPSSDEEARDCLAHLLAAKAFGGEENLLQLIEDALDGDEEARLRLMPCGIRAHGDGEGEGFLVGANHPFLLDVFAGTEWANNIYMRVLRRLKGARFGGVSKFRDQKVRRCTFVPAEHLDLGAAAKR